MTFPVWVDLGLFHVHPHLFFEILAYSGGFQLYRLRKKNTPVATLPVMSQLWLLTACVLGAVFGARLLAWIETPFILEQGVRTWIPPGKTILGGLLGGWMGIEICKKQLGIQRSTGDIYVFPLILGIALGRFGCFLTGLADHTYGTATALPWGVDFGDGILRHPTQLYEILALLCLGGFLMYTQRFEWREGSTFRLFMGGYCLFRFGVEFIKPTYHWYAGLSAIQIAAFLGLLYSGYSFYQLHGKNAQGVVNA